MTAHRLRTAAAKLREVGEPSRCACEDDGETFTDHWFDRSICPEPCGAMHDICVECGYPEGGCMVATAAAQPSPQDLATATWLEEWAEHVEAWAEEEGTYPEGSICDAAGPSDATCNDAAQALADAVLGDKVVAS